MDDARREFQVGLMVFAALAAIVVMVFRFGDIGQSLQRGTLISVIMPSAAGVIPQTPVRLRGIDVGRVQSVELLPDGSGVRVLARIDPEYRLPIDSTAVASRSLLGDAVLDLHPGQSTRTVAPGDRIQGHGATDPAAAISRLEQRLHATLEAFETTGTEWALLASRMNRMLETTGPDGITTAEQVAVAMQQFTRTMRAAEDALTGAGAVLNDPKYQQQLEATMQALPQLLQETRTTLSAVQQVVNRMDTTVAAIHTATVPLAQQSEQLVADLGSALRNVQAMTQDLAAVTRLMNAEDGSLKKFLTDPSVYLRLDRTMASLNVLLQNLGPIVADLQIFSDKIARHPELLGVRGIVRGSDGVKNESVRPAGYRRRE